MINIVTLHGRLTADPEHKQTQSGMDIARFTLAVDRDTKTEGGERKADFIPCVAFQGTANVVTRYFKKGQEMLAKGRITSSSFTDKNGNKRTRIEVAVESVDFCGSKQEGKKETAAESDEFYDADLPF